MSTECASGPRLSLAGLADELGIQPPRGAEAIRIRKVREDSRRIEPGDVFVAIPGTQDDGAAHIADAVRRGAVAILSPSPEPAADVPILQVEDARQYAALAAAYVEGHPTRNLLTIGVTGTNGKTTVCHLAAQILGEDQTTIIGTVANVARGMPSVTTPPAETIQRIARESVSRGQRNLLIEASSIGIEQARVAAVDFDIAAFTHLSHDHLDAHGSMEAYRQAKRRLFVDLAPWAVAVVPKGDPDAERMVAGIDASVITHGGGDADLKVSDVRNTGTGFSFSVGWRGDRLAATLPLPGRHNVDNAAAALGISLVAGMELRQAIERLAEARPVAGRYEVLADSRGTKAVIDYAHTPDALQRILETLRPGARHLTVVFGCQGGSDQLKRPLMGEIAGRLADRVILTSDNPKSEDPMAILDQIAAGVRRGGGEPERVVDRRVAIEASVAESRAGDVVLIAGKGHETYQIIGAEFVPHSDRDVLASMGFTSL